MDISKNKSFFIFGILGILAFGNCGNDTGNCRDNTGNCGNNTKVNQGKGLLSFHTDGVPTSSTLRSFPNPWPGDDFCIEGNFCFQNPRSFPAHLQNLSVQSNTDAWLVALNKETGNSVLQHFNGTKWSVVPSPAFAHSSTPAKLFSVVSNGQNQAYVITEAGELFQCTEQGCTYQIRTVVTPCFISMWGTGSKDVFIYAWSSAKAYLHHYDGTTLLDITDVSSQLSEANYSLFDLFGTSKNDVWAAFLLPNNIPGPRVEGSISALHFDGTKWTKQTWISTPQSLYAPTFAGTSPTNLWLAGFTTDLKLAMYHSIDKGNTWSLSTPTGLPDLIPYIQLKSQDNTLWLEASGSSDKLWQLAGNTWQFITEVPGGFQDLWVLNQNQIRFIQGDLSTYEWNGTSTKALWQADVLGAGRGIKIWGTARDDYWIAVNFLVVNKDHDYEGHLWHIDAQTQTHDYQIPFAPFQEAFVSSIWGTSNNDIWFGVNNCQLLHFDGQSFQRYQLDRRNKMNVVSIWGSASDDVWAVASDQAQAVILHFDGSTWAIIKVYINKELSTVFGLGPNDVWFSGVSSLLHFDGSDLKEIASPNSGAIFGLCGNPGNDAWFRFGADLFHWNGTEFTKEISPSLPLSDVYSMWCSSSGSVWAYVSPISQSQSSIWKRDGSGWHIIAPLSFGSWNLFGISDNDIWAFDYSGRILQRKSH